MASFWQRKSEILGVNARSLLYINRYNTSKSKVFADDKLITKNYLQSRGIGVAKLYATIRNYKELLSFNPDTLPDTFVIKPNHGYGGEGIIVIRGRKGKGFVDANNKKRIWFDDLFGECTEILDGKYAVSGLRDQVIFEELLVPHDTLKTYTQYGLPDVRIIVFNLVPVIAMLRLPTKESSGKANLHSGAIGLGIDIGTGKTTYGVYKNKFVKKLPNGMDIAGLQIPFWNEILLSSCRIQQISNVGYVGVDMTITNSGVKVLEINARAGLNIQIANRAPLRTRLNKVADLKVHSPEEGVGIARTLFTASAKIEMKKEGKPIIGLHEMVEVLNKRHDKILAKIDPHATRNVIDSTLIDEKVNKIIGIKLGEKRINLPYVTGDLKNHKYKAIIAGKFLKDFLIEINKRAPSEATNVKQKISPAILSKDEKIIRNIDKKITEIEKKLAILPRIKPLNLLEEKKLFFENQEYNPKFIYKKLPLDFDQLKKDINRIPLDVNHTLLPIFAAKVEEMKSKISFLQSRGMPEMQKFSEQLYGKATNELYEKAVAFIGDHPIITDESEVVTASKIKNIFQQELKRYGLDHWKIKIDDSVPIDISVSRKNIIIIRDGAKITINRLTTLIAHEIETHIFRYENSHQHRLKLFEYGTVNYLTTEEGLAVYNQWRLGLPIGRKQHLPALLVIASYLGEKMSFSELYKHIRQTYLLTAEEAWKMCVKVKRPLSDTEQHASFTRDIAYFKGYLELSSFIEKNGENALYKLYLGKIGIEDLPTFEGISLNKPKFVPHYLVPPKTDKKNSG